MLTPPPSKGAHVAARTSLEARKRLALHDQLQATNAARRLLREKEEKAHVALVDAVGENAFHEVDTSGLGALWRGSSKESKT